MGANTKVESDVKESEGKNNQKHGHTYIQWLFAVLVSTTLMTYGLQAGWLSPMTKVLQSEQSPTGSPLTDTELSWIGSSLAFTATLGVSVYAYIADKYGRKFGVIAIAVPQALCWAMKIFATNSTMLLIARILGGIPSGGCYNLVPMYLKEISQDNIRGAVVSMALLLQNFGLLAIYAMGSYLDYYTVLYIVIVLPILTTVLMVFAPESPGFLVKKGKFEEAAKTTAQLRCLDINDKQVQAEVEYMRDQKAQFSSLPKISFLNIFNNPARRRGFLLIMILISAQAFNGAYVILTYAWSIMSSSGVTVSPELQSLVVPALMILGSLVSMLCVEKIGRKKLLTSTYILTTLAMLTLASTQLIQSKGGSPPQWLPVVAIAVAVWAYAAGVTPMAYVIMAEMFSFQVRAKLIGCIVTYAWFTSSCQIAVYGPVAKAFGIHVPFFIFGGINLFGAFVTLLLPETKGKTVEEIEEILVRKKTLG